MGRQVGVFETLCTMEARFGAVSSEASGNVSCGGSEPTMVMGSSEVSSSSDDIMGSSDDIAIRVDDGNTKLFP